MYKVYMYNTYTVYVRGKGGCVGDVLETILDTAVLFHYVTIFRTYKHAFLPE
jgi:hypothetical protein